MSSLLRVTTLVFITLALVLVAGAGACGDDGDDGAIDAATASDAAAVDAALTDASQVTACGILCDCAVQFCTQDRTACMDECAGLPASARACRTTHCGYAQDPNGRALHCPHVAGDPNAQGTPSACIFEPFDAGI